MKRFLIVLFLFACLCSACSSSAGAATPTAVPLPVIAVDKAHMTTVGLVYEIPAGRGFILDATDYDFGSDVPMAVQVLAGRAAYQKDWAQDSDRQAVLVADLKPLYNAAPLEILIPGQQLIVSIGRLTKQGSFSPLWVGVVDVR